MEAKAKEIETSQGLFISLKDLNLGSQWLYLGGVAFGITGTFMLASYFLLPLYLGGSISAFIYYGSVLAISFVWLGLIKLINKYWLQNKLISKGEVLCSSKL